MKKILLTTILLIMLLIGCGNPFENFNPTPTPTPGITPTPIPVEPAENPVKFALYDGENLMYYDGENITQAYSGTIKKANKRQLSIDNVLNYFDDYGNVEQSDWLAVEPEAIVTEKNNSSARAVVYNDDVWMLDHIPPDVAYSLGGLYKDYTQIYFNNVALGNWWDQIWNPEQIITTECGLIIGINNTNSYHNINGDEIIFKAYENGLTIYDVDTDSRSGYFADDEGQTFEEWSFNYFFNCKWQQADGIWYASHGYEWSYTDGLTEQANIMWTMNFYDQYPIFFQLPYAQYASICPAGVLEENGEEVLYWIECNRGELFKFIPSINQIISITRIYLGDGTRVYGSNQIDVLKPIWIEGGMYFHHDGSIKLFDPGTGLISIFSEDMEIIEWN